MNKIFWKQYLKNLVGLLKIAGIVIGACLGSFAVVSLMARYMTPCIVYLCMLVVLMLILIYFVTQDDMNERR